MEFAIELVGGPDDGQQIDLLIVGPPFLDWPPEVFVARFVPATACTVHSIRDWEPDAIAKCFWVYRLTDRTNVHGRRVYAWER